LCFLGHKQVPPQHSNNKDSVTLWTVIIGSRKRAYIGECRSREGSQMTVVSNVIHVTRTAGFQCIPPTFEIMFHSGRNTPSASTSTMPPTAMMSSGSIAEVRFFSA
jgi:hypothetical protein